MKNITLGSIIAILLAGGAFGGYKIIRDNTADTFENSIHKVSYVIDGDTIDIENDTRIRLIGINSPERGECFYSESRAYMKELLSDEDIRIEKDISGSDRYDRLLRYVYVPSNDPQDDDVFVNEKMIREGYAKVLAIAPDNRYRDLLSSAEEEAKKKLRGIWGSCKIEIDEKSLREVDTLPKDSSCTIKGNISEKAYGRNYFVEGCPNYNRIKIDTRKGEAYFCTEEEAVASGFKRSESCNNTF